jgi:LCP family protein required for cell wall assembly
MRLFNVGRRTASLLAVLGVGSVPAGVVMTQHVLPGHLTAAQTLGAMFVPDPQRVFGKDHLRVLVVGLDYDYTDGDVESSAHSRSDIIMAINLDFVNHQIDELSVPRDMVATLPDGRVSKINEAQSDGGIRESESVVSQWLGVPDFDRYVVLRIDTMKDLINALGGVTVDVENSDALRHSGANGPIDYDDTWGHLHVHLKPGVQHLDGGQAVGYARFRHDWCSDPCRILRQQQVIHAIAQQIEQNQLNTILHVQPLLDVMHRDVETNLSSGEELSLAMAFAHIDAKDIVTAQVPYVSNVELPDEGDSIVPDEGEKRALVSAMLGDPAPPEPDPQALGSIVPASVQVEVQNGTAVDGLARRVAERLSAAGYVVSAVGDFGASDVAQSTISGGTPSVPLAFKVREALGPLAQGARVAYDTTVSATVPNSVVIVLGADAARAARAAAARAAPAGTRSM